MEDDDLDGCWRLLWFLFWDSMLVSSQGMEIVTFLTRLVRNFFVIQVARELHLIFPSSFATAVTIRSMHLAAGGTSLAKRKMRALSYAFIYAMTIRVVSQYAIGIFWVLHLSSHLFIPS